MILFHERRKENLPLLTVFSSIEGRALGYINVEFYTIKKKKRRGQGWKGGLEGIMQEDGKQSREFKNSTNVHE